MPSNISTRIVGYGVLSLAAGARQIIGSRDRDALRVQFTVSNEEPAGGNILRVVGGVKEALTCFPQSSITLETDGELTIIAPSTNTGATQFVVGSLNVVGGGRVPIAGRAAGGGGGVSGGDGFASGDYAPPGKHIA